MLDYKTMVNENHHGLMVILNVERGFGMKHNIYAACGSNIGNVRKNNEDNFCFNGKYLDVKNANIPSCLKYDDVITDGLSFALFDGMGGGHFGEIASYTAAKYMADIKMQTCGISNLSELIELLNLAVVKEQQKLIANDMGTTMASIHFSRNNIFICNIGDSRVYRVRRESFLQLSVDHVEKIGYYKSGKPMLTQCLGMDPEEVLIVPHILKRKFESGDVYLLCSDGLTDMVSDFEIHKILSDNKDAEIIVNELISLALERGGKDNITIIVCIIN